MARTKVQTTAVRSSPRNTTRASAAALQESGASTSLETAITETGKPDGRRVAAAKKEKKASPRLAQDSKAEASERLKDLGGADIEPTRKRGRPGKIAKVEPKVKAKEEESEEEVLHGIPIRKARSKVAKTEPNQEESEEEVLHGIPISKAKSKTSESAIKAPATKSVPPETTQPKSKNERKRKQPSPLPPDNDKGEDDDNNTDIPSAPKPKRPRKTAAEKAAAAMPLAARTLTTPLTLGAHVSASGGVHNAITNAVHIGGNAFALFLKSQRKWANPPLDPAHASEFKAQCSGNHEPSHRYDADKHVLPHGSYLVNLAHKDAEKAAQSYATFVDDLRRCETLGIRLYNFHPGNTGGEPRSEAVGRIAAQLNRAHAETKGVVTVLENMAGNPVGNTIGGAFEDLRDVIALVKDKARVGVCLDTCHTFAAGYDLRSPEAFGETMGRFGEVVGWEYLKALHVNDSKAPLGSHRDLHYNIGLGFLGLRAFHNVVNEKRFWGLPLILETPIEVKNEEGKEVEDKKVWADEIKLLESMVGMDADGAEFEKMERERFERGREERAKFQGQADRRNEKEKKAMEKWLKASPEKKAKMKKPGMVTGEDGED